MHMDKDNCCAIKLIQSLLLTRLIISLFVGFLLLDYFQIQGISVFVNFITYYSRFRKHLYIHDHINKKSVRIETLNILDRGYLQPYKDNNQIWRKNKIRKKEREFTWFNQRNLCPWAKLEQKKFLWRRIQNLRTNL